jgi:hypothetical protein
MYDPADEIQEAFGRDAKSALVSLFRLGRQLYDAKKNKKTERGGFLDNETNNHNTSSHQQKSAGKNTQDSLSEILVDETLPEILTDETIVASELSKTETKDNKLVRTFDIKDYQSAKTLQNILDLSKIEYSCTTSPKGDNTTFVVTENSLANNFPELASVLDDRQALSELLSQANEIAVEVGEGGNYQSSEVEILGITPRPEKRELTPEIVERDVQRAKELESVHERSIPDKNRVR